MKTKKLIRKDKIHSIKMCSVGILLAIIATTPYYTDSGIENIFPVFFIFPAFVVLLINILVGMFTTFSALICLTLGGAMHRQAQEREMKRAQEEDFNHEVHNLLETPREEII